VAAASTANRTTAAASSSRSATPINARSAIVALASIATMNPPAANARARTHPAARPSGAGARCASSSPAPGNATNATTEAYRWT
jgi:hypothetical protein